MAGHPIAREIADEFGVPVEEVERYHGMGIGYGILAQFYSIANNRCGATASYTVDQLVAMKQGGMGMGEIRKQALGTASAKECSLGRLKQGALDDADAKVAKPEAPAPTKKPKKDKPAAPAQPAKKPAPPKPAKPNKPAQAKPNKPAQAKPNKPAPQPQPPKKDNGGGKGKK